MGDLMTQWDRTTVDGVDPAGRATFRGVVAATDIGVKVVLLFFLALVVVDPTRPVWSWRPRGGLVASTRAHVLGTFGPDVGTVPRTVWSRVPLHL